MWWQWQETSESASITKPSPKSTRVRRRKIYIEDLTSDYIANYIYPTLKAQAIYEGKYLLGTSTARPCIAKRMVDIAKAENCTAIAHGCTGKETIKSASN